MDQMPRTELAFHHDSQLYRHATEVLSVQPFESMAESLKQLFKSTALPPDASVVITKSTIFHPQGGGQPSDEGTITAGDDASAAAPDAAVFNVVTARTAPSGHVLHAGTFNSSSSSSTSSSSSPAPPFEPGTRVTQAIDAEKRDQYSRLHTAGHVLGAAVRHLLEKEVPGFDELKASHFPHSAACEFAGLIDGKWKGPIQEKVDAYIAAKMPVEIDFWDEAEFRRQGLERLLPQQQPNSGNGASGSAEGGSGAGGAGGGAPLGIAPGEKLRVVKIVGAEVYPCGGTHVAHSGDCGKTTVRKIARSKGISRVAYAVE